MDVANNTMAWSLEPQNITEMKKVPEPMERILRIFLWTKDKIDHFGSHKVLHSEEICKPFNIPGTCIFTRNRNKYEVYELT